MARGRRLDGDLGDLDDPAVTEIRDSWELDDVDANDDIGLEQFVLDYTDALSRKYADALSRKYARLRLLSAGLPCGRSRNSCTSKAAGVLPLLGTEMILPEQMG